MSFQAAPSPRFAGGLITSSVFIHGDVAPGWERSEVSSLVSPKSGRFPQSLVLSDADALSGVVGTM